MYNRIYIILLGALFLSTLCVGQQPAVPAFHVNLVDGIGLPGQMWVAIGNVSPIEHNNVYFQSHAEQGAEIFAIDSQSITVTPYISITGGFDTAGYDWNNKIVPSLGMRANKFFRAGILSLGSSYSYEDRFNNLKSSGLTLYAQDWFGWQAVSEKNSRFPGSSWAAVGNLSTVERGNIIAQAHISQGVVGKRLAIGTVMPYVEATLCHDTQGVDWENKAVYGSGIKVGIPHDEMYTEIGAAYLRENRFHSGQSAGELTVFMNFALSWNLLGRKVGN